MTTENLTLYVSPWGKDSWTGRNPEPGVSGRDGPFATPERAREAIRELRRAGQIPPNGVTVLLRGGIYWRSSTFELSQEDSGNSGSPIVYSACPGEEVRWIGGREISGFRPVESPAILERLDPAARGKVLQTDLKAQGITDYGTLTSRGFGRPIQPAALELFFRDQPMTLARWPNREFTTIASVPNPTKDFFEGGSKEGKFHYSGDRPRRWAGVDDLWVHGYWTYDWANSYEKVNSIQTETREIATVEPHGVYGYREGQRFYFLNLLEELDEPGEWYLDRKSGILYFWPPAPLDSGKVVASMLEGPLVSMREVSYVTIRGLMLECARGHGIQIAEGKGNRVGGCTLRNLGNFAVLVNGGFGHAVIGCDIYETGDGGVKISGGDRKTLTPGGHWIHNNHFHHFGRWSRCYYPAVLMDGVGHRISNNLIHDGPHCGILYTGNDHFIELNEIFNICLETGDVGAIYTGRDYTWRGNVIRYNFIHHTGGVGMGSNGIYLDDCVSGHTVFGNIFYKTPRAAFIGGGRDTLVENNIFVECDPAVSVDGRGLDPNPVWQDMVYKTMKERLESMNYLEPPYITRYPKLADLQKYYEEKKGVPPEGNSIVRNIFVGGNWLKAGWQIRPETCHLSDNLVDVDPLFVDAANGNFQLRPDSPAHPPGFQRIPAERIGLVRDEYRPRRRLVHSRLELVKPASTHGDPGRVRLTLKNLGDARARGEVALASLPSHAARVVGEKALVFDLQPMGEISREFVVQGNAGVFLLETESSFEALRPSRLQLFMEWPMKRMSPIHAVDRVAAALNSEPMQIVKHQDCVLAELRFGVAGSHLAVLAKVFDWKMKQAPRSWEGSCIELFGSMPGRAPIGQVYLLPQTAERPARAMRQEGDHEQPAPEISLKTESTGGGYEVQALIPLGLLALSMDSRQFLLECAVSAAPSRDRGFLRGTLFGSASAYNNHSYYGRVILKD